MSGGAKTSCWIQSSILSVKSGDREYSLSEEKIKDFVHNITYGGVIRRVGNGKGDISPHMTVQYLGKFTAEERAKLFDVAKCIWGEILEPIMTENHRLEKMGTFVGNECFMALNFELKEHYQKIIRLRKALHNETRKLGIEVADPTSRQWNPHVSLLQFESEESMNSFYYALDYSVFEDLLSMPILFTPPSFAFYDEEKNLHVEEFAMQ